MSKVNKDNLKSSKTKTVTYKGANIRQSDDFSTETFQIRRENMKYSK